LEKEGYAFSFYHEIPTYTFEKPSLLLTGWQDAMVGCYDAWSIVQNYPRMTFAVLDRAGHDLQIEQEKLFNTLANECLDRVVEHAESNVTC
jgi:pimeloyl-ACP methyl ester carboxylesterase